MHSCSKKNNLVLHYISKLRTLIFGTWGENTVLDPEVTLISAEQHNDAEDDAGGGVGNRRGFAMRTRTM